MRYRKSQLSLDETDTPSDDDQADIFIVFVGKTECRYLKFLKAGFRHCFTAMRMADRWIVCDSLKSRIEFSIVALPSDFDLARFYHDRGHTVIVGRRFPQHRVRTMLPELFTCVTVVKRIIGIQSFWPLTPWQLFRLLNSNDGQWRLIE